MKIGRGIAVMSTNLNAGYIELIAQKHLSDIGLNGKWHGPFPDRAAAFKVAAGLNEREAGLCVICSP
jgi:hypothetical protein